MDTIYALASAPGKAGVSVVRISGPDAFLAGERLCGSGLPDAGRTVRTVLDSDKNALDQALVLTFKAPKSFTGEHVVELHLHGSPAGVSSVLHALGRIDGLRMAEAGEFTRRAMENGKLNLAQVEGLADLIDAETESQRRQALRVFSGDLGSLVERWRVALVRAASLIEATIDFADEDVPVDVGPEVDALLTSVDADLGRQTSGVVMAERIRSGFEVAIVGPPNSGKSTLLNALAGRKAALTSEIAGTTRDVIEIRMDLAGLAVTLLDTAGLRETEDVVESLGIGLAKDRASAADLRVFLCDDPGLLDVFFEKGDLHLYPKADLRSDRTFSVSGVTGEGIDDLIRHLSDELTRRSASAGLATRERHRLAMEQARLALRDARRLLERGPDSYDIASEELRRAVRALESLVGRIDVEDLLDEIFASFCIGK